MIGFLGLLGLSMGFSHPRRSPPTGNFITSEFRYFDPTTIQNYRTSDGNWIPYKDLIIRDKEEQMDQMGRKNEKAGKTADLCHVTFSWSQTSL